MRKTKKAAIKIAPYITGALFVLVIGGATLILLWPNITSDTPVPAPRGSVIDNKLDEMVKITVYTNGGVPQKWRYTISEPSALEYYDMISYNEAPGEEGGPVKLEYYFKPLKEGNVSVLFEYYNFVDDDQPVTKAVEYNVSIDKDLKFEVGEVQLDAEEK